MKKHLKTVLPLLAIGTIAGFMNGLLGAGGGIIVVMALRLIFQKSGASEHSYYTTAIAVMLPLSLLSVWQYRVAGHLPPLSFWHLILPSLLGGALGASGREDPDAPLDQEMINRQIDYALEHGINYFDTSPAYCKGRSEEATGIALARHKRTDYFIATKLSNFAPETWPEKESKAMFEQSLKYLQTDYVDYLLLHSVGGGDDCYQILNSL